jgi:hypothetical protein
MVLSNILMQKFMFGPKSAVNNINTDNNDGKNFNGKKGLSSHKSVLSFTKNQRLWRCNVYKTRPTAQKLKGQ